MNAWLLRIALLACVMLSGCDLLPKALTGARRVAADTNDIQKVDLAQEIRAETPTKVAKQDKCTTTQYYPTQNGGQAIEASPKAQRCLRRVAKAFYADPVDLSARRNRVQARLLAASDLACGEFEQKMNFLQANTNMIAGIATTAAAGAGAIVTNEVTARVLSGVGAVIAGSRAEFNADFFYREAVPVVVKAINADRRNFRNNIIALHRAESIGDYTLWDAIADAFRYNQRCSLVAGLSQLETAVTLADNPGLDTLNRVLIQNGISQQIIEGKITTYGQVLAQSTASPSAIRSSMTGTEVSTQAVADQYRADADAIWQARAMLNTALQQREKDIPQSRDKPASKTIANLDATMQKIVDTVLPGCVNSVVTATQALATAQARRAVTRGPDPTNDIAASNAASTLDRLSSQLDAFTQAVLQTIGGATVWLKNQQLSQPIKPSDWTNNVATPITQLSNLTACST